MNKTALMVLSMIFYCWTSSLYSQQKVRKPLKKGDTIPPLAFMLHTDKKIESINIGDYKGKLLLLDFWGVHCADCIASLPRMLELQKQFQRKLKIIIVTEDLQTDVEELWRRFSKKSASLQWINAGKQLPFIMGDSILTTLFPHSVLPTHVWIDTNQVIKAIAYNNSTTAANIQSYFEGRQPRLSEQKYFDLDPAEPLSWFRNKIVDEANTPYYSFVTKRIEYGNGGRHIVRDFKDPGTGYLIGIVCVNSSILDLYKIAYKDELGLVGRFPDNRIQVQTKDSTKFFNGNNSYLSWAERNSFCFAFKQPPCSSEQFYSAMKTNLDCFFHLQSTLETRNVKCWILKQTESAKKIKTRGGPERFESKSDSLILQNMDFRNLFLELKNVISICDPDAVCLDETQFQGNIDIKLPWNKRIEDVSFSDVQKSLQRHGLQLVHEYRNIDMLILRDK
jgi:thiol-disulfide isomerase/thioredoxin